MKRLFSQKAKNGLITSRDVNEARGGLVLAVGRVCSKKKKVEKKKKRKNPPHPEHTTKAAAARRTRPPRDGARKNTSHALGHARTLPKILGFVEIGLVQLSQSVKTTNVTHTDRHTDGQTDQLNSGTLYAPRY